MRIDIQHVSSLEAHGLQRTSGSHQLLRRAWYLPTLLMALFLAGCTTVQTTKPGAIGIDRAQRMSILVSEAELQQGAVQAYAQVIGEERKKGKLNSDAAMTKRVRAIAQRIIPQVKVYRVDALKWDWQVNVIQSDQLNAWAMPGGKIAFYSGIINRLKLTDAEIAGIMGHEIAHALREHSRERASDQANSNFVFGIGGALVGLGSGATQAAQMAYNTTFGLKHSRSHETEADRMGVELAARAGYDPRAAISVWQKMAKASSGKSGPEWLSTHPSNASRIADLKVYSAKVMPLYRKPS